MSPKIFGWTRRRTRDSSDARKPFPGAQSAFAVACSSSTVPQIIVVIGNARSRGSITTRQFGRRSAWMRAPTRCNASTPRPALRETRPTRRAAGAGLLHRCQPRRPKGLARGLGRGARPPNLSRPRRPSSEAPTLSAFASERHSAGCARRARLRRAPPHARRRAAAPPPPQCCRAVAAASVFPSNLCALQQSL